MAEPITNPEDLWGFHMILDCRACDTAAISSREVLDKWVRDLVDLIDMRAYGEPILEHFANHDPNKGGYTLVQLIETSSITGHFVDSTGDAYIDVFSCKPFEPNTVIGHVEAVLKPKGIRASLIGRLA